MQPPCLEEPGTQEPGTWDLAWSPYWKGGQEPVCHGHWAASCCLGHKHGSRWAGRRLPDHQPCPAPSWHCSHHTTAHHQNKHLSETPAWLSTQSAPGGGQSHTFLPGPRASAQSPTGRAKPWGTGGSACGGPRGGGGLCGPCSPLGQELPSGADTRGPFPREAGSMHTLGVSLVGSTRPGDQHPGPRKGVRPKSGRASGSSAEAGAWAWSGPPAGGGIPGPGDHPMAPRQPCNETTRPGTLCPSRPRCPRV